MDKTTETQGNTESGKKILLNLIIHDLFHNEKEKAYFVNKKSGNFLLKYTLNYLVYGEWLWLIKRIRTIHL